MILFEQNCNDLKMAVIGRNIYLFFLLSTIINPHYHSCVFMNDIYLTISLSTHNANDKPQNYEITCYATTPTLLCLLHPNNLLSDFFTNNIDSFSLTVLISACGILSTISNVLFSVLKRKPLIDIIMSCVYFCLLVKKIHISANNCERRMRNSNLK